MLARRLRRRPNIDPTLVQCLVFAGTYTPEGEHGHLYISDDYHKVEYLAHISSQ